MLDNTGPQAARQCDEPVPPVIEETMRMLLHQGATSDELVVSPWVGLHYRNEYS